jgi:hypothetical protein
VTNGATNWTAVLYTNVFTNVISDRIDHAMMVDLDAKIIALCPYFANTNTVYDGTTNIVMHTFTGLLTSLNLGDHTNFTSIPCWTNNAGTTNATTNAATFGPWAWRNYVVAWQERYKVLNALKWTAPSGTGISTGWHDVPDTFSYGSWNDAQDHSEAYFTNDTSYSATEFQCFTAGFLYTNNATYMSWIRTFRMSAPTLSATLNTDISHSIYFYLKPTLSEMPGTLTKTNGAVFDDNGLGLTLDTWGLITNYPFGLSEGTAPTWCAEPTTASVPGWHFEPQYTGFQESRGFVIKAANQKHLVDWQFTYATNKYW